MNFVESRFVGIEIGNAGREAVLSFIEVGGNRFTLKLHGIDKLLVTEMRQQNIVEELTHRTKDESSPALRESAFLLFAGSEEGTRSRELAAVVEKVLDHVSRDELDLFEMTAVYGAQVLAAFSSMTLQAD